jgi:hypothetical protein
LFDVIAQNKNDSCHVWDRAACRVLMGKPEGKKLLGRSGRRWQNNIKIEFKEICWDGADWIYLARDMDRWRGPVNMVMKLRVHKREIICWLAEDLLYPQE